MSAYFLCGAKTRLYAPIGRRCNSNVASAASLPPSFPHFAEIASVPQHITSLGPSYGPRHLECWGPSDVPGKRWGGSRGAADPSHPGCSPFKHKRVLAEDEV